MGTQHHVEGKKPLIGPGPALSRRGAWRVKGSRFPEKALAKQRDDESELLLVAGKNEGEGEGATEKRATRKPVKLVQKCEKNVEERKEYQLIQGGPKKK